jgi:hypothetical protein
VLVLQLGEKETIAGLQVEGCRVERTWSWVNPCVNLSWANPCVRMK